MGYGGMATDDAAVADGDAGEYRAEFTNPNVVLNNYGLPHRQGTFRWRHVGTVGVITTIDAVVVVSNINLATHENVVTNFNVVDAADVDVLAKAHIVPDNEARCEVLLTVRGNSLHPESPTRRKMLANLHILHATDVRIMMDVNIPPAKDTTRKDHVLDALPIDK